MHHGRRPLGVLNSVLVQNLLRFCKKKTGKETHTKNVIKLCSILQKIKFKIAWPNNCVTLSRDFLS